MSNGSVARPSGEQEYVPYVVVDVLNYGGFFGGETVTLDAAPMSAPDKIVGFIIPEHLFDNLTQRHLLAAGMALGLQVDGGEVRAATVLGAPTREQLKEIVKQHAPSEAGPGPRALSYRCSHCNLWLSGTPDHKDDGFYYCRVCGTKLG
ncbi:MAG: TFIIB-type zinc finger domain-containing protein [Chloroflexota bacterium]